jgi:hypothetical protein
MKFFTKRKSSKGEDELDRSAHHPISFPGPAVVAVEGESSAMLQGHPALKTTITKNQSVAVTIAADTASQATDGTQKKSYYDGSSEIATETPLTLTRLEPVRILVPTMVIFRQSLLF